MVDKIKICVCVVELWVGFEVVGVIVVEILVLQLVEVFLDFYGEDIWGCVYVILDVFLGEQMLCLDFMVFVVQMYMVEGVEFVCYIYFGEVFWCQEDDSSCVNEYMQVGYEVFDCQNLVVVDVEVFILVCDVVMYLNLWVVIGDIGFLVVVVVGFEIIECCKVVFVCYFWWLCWFCVLLDWFFKLMFQDSYCVKLVVFVGLFVNVGLMIGLCGVDEIEVWIVVIKEDIIVELILVVQVELIDELLNVCEILFYVIDCLCDIVVDMFVISGVVM